MTQTSPIDRTNAVDAELVVPPSPMAAPGVAAGLEAAPLPMPPAPPPAPQTEEAALPQPGLHVAFVGQTRKGKQRVGRAIITGFFEITNISTLNALERLIAERRELTAVEITSWRLLSMN